jgi:hypothetical protein
VLNDIVKITNIIFKKFIPHNNPVNSAKNIYDVYRALEVVISDTRLVSEHYLALTFDEDFLQSSSFGKPSDKWRYFFNKDLEELDNSIKKYFMKLRNIAPEDSSACSEGYICSLFDSKIYDLSVNDMYSAGYIKPCSFKMLIKSLTTKFDPKNYFIINFKEINLATYEDRISLQKHLRKKRALLEKSLAQLKEYILKNYTLDDLL